MNALAPLCWLGCWLGCLLLSLGVVAACLCAVRSLALRAHFANAATRVDAELRYLQLRIPARALLGAQAALTLIGLLWFAASRNLLGLVLAGVVLRAPGVLLSRARRERSARIERQLDTFLLALANALRASPALPGAIATCADAIARPLSGELQLALREQRLGLPLERALRNLADRTRSPVTSAAFAILRVAGATGGDLSHTLEVAAASLREMARLEGVVRSKTAEGRAQVVVIAVAPIGLVWALEQADPDLLAPLWTTPTGHAVVAAALVLWVAALLAARRIVAVDI